MNPMIEHNEKSISFQELFVLLKRYLLLIIVAGLIGGIVTYCTCSFLVDPVYEASAKMIVNSGISRVVYGEGYPDEFSLEIFREAGVQLDRFTPEAE